MVLKVRLHARAWRDLVAIRDYLIQQANPQAAERVQTLAQWLSSRGLSPGPSVPRSPPLGIDGTLDRGNKCRDDS